MAKLAISGTLATEKNVVAIIRKLCSRLMTVLSDCWIWPSQLTKQIRDNKQNYLPEEGGGCIVLLFCDSHPLSVFFVVTSNCTMGGLPLQDSTSALALPGTESKQNQVSTAAAPPFESKPKKKICCACPETKKLRDECIVQHGEDACTKWIEAHLNCLRAEGFNV